MWKYVVENISLAFGSLFPNVELALFGIIPVKAKYLAFLAGALILLEFLLGSPLLKLILIVAFAPYLLFFGPMLFRSVRGQLSSSARRKRFKSDMWR